MKRRVTTTVRGAKRRWISWLSVIAASLAAGYASADIFVVPLVKSVKDDLTTVSVGLGPKNANVNVVIDTGYTGSIYLSPAAASSAGLDLSTGTPGTVNGVGGQANITIGVNAGNPALTGDSTPVVPSGQAATTPTLPNTATVAPLPTGVPGLLGKGFLDNYYYATLGKSMVFAKKDEGTKALKDGISLAESKKLAYVPLGPDGWPVGLQTQPLVAVASNPGDFDGGFSIGVSVTALGTGQTASNEPFVLCTGLSETLITTTFAESLGLSPSALPVAQVDGDIGPIDVPQANLSIQLFGSADTTFSIPVGITSDADNPLGVNALGTDILSEFAYWDISADSNGNPVFDATVVPEPTTFALLGIGALGLLGYAVRPRKAKA